MFESDEILRVFFGPGNNIQWSEYVSKRMPSATCDAIRPWIERIEQKQFPFLLPRLRKEGNAEWYAIADSPQQFRCLGEELQAFVGKTYTDYNGAQAVLDHHDPIDSIIGKHFSPFVYRLRVDRKKELRDACRNAFMLLRGFWNRELSSTPILTKPQGRLIRDFELALQVKNEDSARECITGLLNAGHLDASNYKYLEVQLLSGMDRCDELLDLDGIYDVVCRKLRPKRVTQALIESVYRVHLEQYEINGNPQSAIDKFKDLQSQYGALFTNRISLSGPVILKAFALRYANHDKPELSQLQQVLKEMAPCPDSESWIKAIIDSVSDKVIHPKSSTDKYELAERAYGNEDYDVALRHYLNCPTSQPVLSKAIVCACEINSIETTLVLLDHLEQSPDDVLKDVLSKRHVKLAYDGLKKYLLEMGVSDDASPQPQGWKEWMVKLNEEGAWDSAYDIVEQNAVGWRLTKANTAIDDVKSIAESVQADRQNQADKIFDNCLPKFMDAIFPEDQIEPVFGPIYSALALLMSTKEKMSADELTALSNLIEANLYCNALSRNDIIEIVEDAWGRFASVRHMDWVVDVFDILVLFNVMSDSNIEPLLNSVLDTARKAKRLVSGVQWQLLDYVCKDIGLDCLPDGLRPLEESDVPEGDSSLSEALVKKTIAIYTLTEKIGHRAAALIKQTFKEVSVELCFDKVATDRIRNLSRNADIMIMNKYDAKHSATEAIKEHRGKDQVTLIPRSKSSGSLFRELYQFAET